MKEDSLSFVHRPSSIVYRPVKQEIKFELLLGRKVYAANGRVVGRLEEACAELRRGECFVEEYHVGSYALFERLAAVSLFRALLGRLGARGGYRVPWDKLDLSDPERPRLRCAVEELERLRG